jgi:uncharacterized protein YcfJ
MRNTLTLALLLGISCVSIAQSSPASWAQLTGLKPGEKIQIAEITGKKHTGTFESVSDSAISIREASGEASVQKQDVRSVKLLKSNRRLRHTLIGLAIGAGAGGGIGAGTWESHGFLGGKGTGAAVCAVIGGLAGIAVGALLPTHDTVYQASPH